ncbi:hypothetical protein JMJ58_19290 [Haloterrigena salifodinae]|uniref:Uncharacterized protein n=1 Tax=Haloterrigena salifodinae TaxID=2675099 RepID=A0A8T8E070_9EURY|nr:hypothetical protein [Haloterrigena salifodinae]QRV15027.1 hypothetical protein JMJ58_19290 [Haloterrigena salifodinae]
MTWTLRLLDADGTEVGWATADPHEYEVDSSLPDAEMVDAMLDMMGTETSSSAPHDWVAEDGVVNPRMTEFVAPNETPARDRLEECAVALVREGWVADYELADE